MLFNSVRLLGFGLAIAIALSFAATHGHSEIAATGGQNPSNAALVTQAKTPTKELPKQDASLWVQCWQSGIKIIDEKDIFGIRLQNLIERESVGFRGRDSNNREVYVIPVNDDSTCLVKPSR